MSTDPRINEFDPQDFYPGAQRTEILDQLWAAAGQDVPIMVLIGEEGSGKTVMCQMFSQRAPAGCTVVYFPQTVESFEDVVRIIATRLGLQPKEAVEGRYVEAIVGEIATHLGSRKESLVVVFDEAENLYLATLERIRKMLDRIRQAGARLHLLFAGRKTFVENCEQLSICDFETDNDVHFSLPPLSEAETEEFLRLDKQARSGSSTTEDRLGEMAHSIYKLARGNFRMTTMLAEESLAEKGDSTSFMTLLETVKEEVDDIDSFPAAGAARKLLPRYRLLLIPVAGLFLLLAVYLFWPAADSPIDHIKSTAQRPPAPQSSPATPGAAENVSPQLATRQEDGAETSTAPQTNTLVRQRLDEKTTPAADPPQEEPSPDEQPPAQVGATMPESVGEKSDVGKAAEAVPVEAAVTEKRTPRQAEEPSNREVTTTPGKSQANGVVLLKADSSLKIKPDVPVTKERGLIHVQPRTEVQSVVTANGHLSPSQLYQKRIMAGAVWKTGAKNDKYTVQLMVLTSQNAEDNLKEMLGQTNYRQESGNFYIFKKGDDATDIFVFYGEYDTMAAARLAQKSLPKFLSMYSTPYAIPIKDAIAKVQNKS